MIFKIATLLLRLRNSYGVYPSRTPPPPTHIRYRSDDFISFFPLYHKKKMEEEINCKSLSFCDTISLSSFLKWSVENGGIKL